jgi:hypothetical protein
VAIVALFAASAGLLEAALGFQHLGFDVGRYFAPNWSWWWSGSRWGGGWNPWVFAGYPSNADPQLAIVHPLGALYWLLPPALAAGIEGALLPTLAGIGMLLFLRGQACDRAGTLVGALAFAFGGFFVGHAPHLGILRAVAVLPWALLAVDRLEGRRLASGLGVCIGLILIAGHPQASGYTLLLLAAYCVWLGGAVGRRGVCMAAAVALGLALSAAVWLPAGALVQASTRSVGAPVFPNPKLLRADMSRLLLPRSESPSGPALLRDALGCGFIECSGFPGVVAWLAILAGIPAVIREPRGRFWLAVGVAGMMGATGAIPLPLGVRGPARLLLWWTTGIAVVAGMGTSRIRGRFFLPAAILLAGAIAVVTWWRPEDRPFALAAFLTLAVALTMVRLSRRLPLLASVGLVALLGAELAVYGAVTMPAAIAPEVRAAALAPLDFIATLTRTSAAHRPTDRVLVLPIALEIQNVASRRIMAVQGYDPLAPLALARLLGQDVALGLGEIGATSDATLAAPNSHALDLLRVRLVVHDREGPTPLGTVIASAVAEKSPRWRHADTVSQGPREYFVNERVRPVAWLVGRSRVVEQVRALELIRGEARDAPFDPAREVLVEELLAGFDAHTGTAGGAAPELGTAELVRYEDDAIEVAVDAQAPAVLVTSEMHYPGWVVAIDGAPARLLRVNYAFRGVVVPAGRHRIEFRYAPTLARIGLLVSGLALIVALALFRVR